MTTQSIGKKRIKRAIISVYHKDDLPRIAMALNDLDVEIYATGGTFDAIARLQIPVKAVEALTHHPAILDGRVKTLHPKIFGGILARPDHPKDMEELLAYSIPLFDLIVVDLYPFQEALTNGANWDEMIEKIDIGGVSLIRAAAKNHQEVVVISRKDQYPLLLNILTKGKGITHFDQRKDLATEAFRTTSLYDGAIYDYLAQNHTTTQPLRYGENPHQAGHYIGPAHSLPKKLHGKELSYNNLLDIEAAIELISDFSQPTIAIIKHTNPCGCASDSNLLKAWEKALNADPISAFGGVVITNCPIDTAVAKAIHPHFFEIIAAPSFSEEVLQILTKKKKRIILQTSSQLLPRQKTRSLLQGVLVQDRDTVVEQPHNLVPCTLAKPKPKQIKDLIFANIVAKHTKSNAIVLAKDNMLLASGMGQCSRIDALRQAIEKAKQFDHSLENAVMASDAFFPFSDCAEMAYSVGITAIVQPGGSLRDNESIDVCDDLQIAMVFTNTRHFKH
ncbi:MAG: bifunctional phosphoribosylaminoimidazolecarboxamide formyltransferase/IMP cyclohydrolase [Prevotellaceae bacterium]|nr:bifunctional phosphoribosylaminoimidazolecarboxamide formyltransferase/IMP cyclohydrolase [Prevotellaceae bacterium]